jgi:hypothetical protein
MVAARFIVPRNNNPVEGGTDRPRFSLPATFGSNHLIFNVEPQAFSSISRVSPGGLCSVIS